MLEFRVGFRAIFALLSACWLLGIPLRGWAQGDSGSTGSEAAPLAPTLPEIEAVPASDYTAPPPGIEAIEVTGERVDDTNVQDQAQAITAFSGADLDRANIVSVDSLAFSVPGLHVGQSAQAPIITLRGIGTENASLTGEPGVAFHVDGINLGRPGAARVAFFDLETLDVKRGPQGLMGGKNSTSGSINLITRKPTDDLEASGDVLFGNYDRQRFRGTFNVPLGEFAALRLAGYKETRDGFLDNKYVGSSEDPFDADDQGLRGHLRVNPSDSLEMLFSYNYFEQGGQGPQANPVPILQEFVPFGTPPEEIPPGFLTGCNTNASPNTTVTPQLSAPTSTVMPRNSACYTRRVATGNQQPIPDPSRIFHETVRTGNPMETKQVTITQKPVSTIRNYFGPGKNGYIFEKADVLDRATENSDPRAIYLDSAPSQDNRYWGWTSHLTWDAPQLPLLGETQVRLLGGFQETTGDIAADFDGTDARLSNYTANDKADQYSIEGQWSGTSFAENLDWQASLFHLHERASRDVLTPGLTPENGSTSTAQSTSNYAYGAALNGSYGLTDSLRVSLGGRWIKDKKETLLLRDVEQGDNNPDTARFRGCTGNLGLINGPARPARDNVDCQDTFRGTMWGTGLEWRPFGDDHLLYAKLDRGYKSGGFRAGTVGRYLPEKIWAYSAGTKSEFFDQRLRMNFEGFFYDYTDLQIVIVDGLALRTENTDAEMYGWDLETQATPIDGLNLSGVLSFLHTETVDYFSLDPANNNQFQNRRLEMRDAAEANEEEGLPGSESDFATKTGCYKSVDDSNIVTCGTLGDKDGLDDFTGNQLSRSPKWKYTLSADYQIPLGRFGSLTPRVQYTWQDDTYFRAFNRDFDLQEEYHLTDLKLTWNSPEDRWTVEAFVQNIEDEAPKQNVLVGPRYFGSPPLAWYGPPRFYGMMVGFKY